MVSESESDTCTVCYHAKALLSQAVLVDSSIISFNCGHGVTEIVDTTREPSNILEPISIKTITDELIKNSRNEEKDHLGCLICSEVFPIVKDGEKSPLLAHLLVEHKIVIADVDKIADFNRYINYWRERFSKMTDITDYCVMVNPKPEEKENEEKEKEEKEQKILHAQYFLLTDFLPEDELLRQNLNLEKLRKVLDEQQRERKDGDFLRCCLFCKVQFHGNRAELFKHMAVEHSFNVGNSDNIVHATEFIDLMQAKLDNHVCLFCENEFKDNSNLKDHMKKKGHKRIDPTNKEYDPFYLINYLDPGKNWKEVQSEPEYEKEGPYVAEEDIFNESIWEEWTEAGTMVSLCLFCTNTNDDVNNIIDHMKDIHHFDLHTIKVKLSLDFYDQVKIINYIRKQVHQNNCPSCLLDLKTKDSLNEHFFTERHYGLPEDRSVWDQPKYYFPTFDDDSLLCFIEDDDEEEDENKNVVS